MGNTLYYKIGDYLSKNHQEISEEESRIINKIIRKLDLDCSEYDNIEISTNLNEIHQLVFEIIRYSKYI